MLALSALLPAYSHPSSVCAVGDLHGDLIAEQVVNELACGGGGRVHGAKCLATLAGVA